MSNSNSLAAVSLPSNELSAPSGARTDRISIRVSAEERAALKRNRASCGSELDLGAWIRDVALKADAKQPARLPSTLVEPALLATLRAELSADIARVGNETHQVHGQVALLLASLNSHSRALGQILKLLGAA